jgi:uncharacterized phage protein gp47/JayE
MAGLTLTGFEKETTETIQAKIGEDLLTNLDATLDLSPEEPLGNIVASASAVLATAWEAVEDLYSMINRGSAEGIALDNVNGLTGTTREKQRKGIAVCTVNVEPSTTLLAGTLTANVVGQPDNTWVNIDDAVNASGVAADVTGIRFQSTQYGPVVANAGTITETTAPVTGWNSVTNPLDATVGALVEEDTPYRVRGDEEVARPGTGTYAALLVDVKDVENVLTVSVAENDTDYPVGELPGHSFKVRVWDGASPLADDDEIAQAVWGSKPTGVQAVGDESGTAIDSEGGAHTVHFARLEQVELYVTLTLVTSSDYPVDGNDQVKALIKALGDRVLQGGVDFNVLLFRAEAQYRVIVDASTGTQIELGIKGVTNVTSLKVGDAPSPPDSADWSITDDQIGRLDTSRIVIT